MLLCAEKRELRRPRLLSRTSRRGREPAQYRHRCAATDAQGSAPSKMSSSARRTASSASNSIGPIAERIACDCSRAEIDTSSDCGSRSAPSASSSCSAIEAGSTATSGRSASARSTPCSPAAITAPVTRYGLALWSKHLISKLAVACSSPLEPATRRRAASRFSRPQHAYTPAQ